ncbi:hypothetical protein QLG13_08525 [Rhodococcus aetherivorans]|uniref:hypothetical protein n=1 Tax=Rhodococcus aetherivorans TaxID=191292 RepID=UPI0002D227A4|nr:hypothetical protein [Rhodococcus aetherivorans]CCW11112.1 Mobile element protein [Rhodococcus aetherivorans]
MDATPEVVARIEQLRREKKWSARRIALEPATDGFPLSVRIVSRHPAHPRVNRRRFLDPPGDSNREPRRIVAHWPGHMVHVDIKKVGRIPDGGGWRVHGRGSVSRVTGPHQTLKRNASQRSVWPI